MGRQLGRGVVVGDHAPPAAWAGADVVAIDEATLSTPGPAVIRLHEPWVRRRPVVVELAVDPARFRIPESITGDVWRHSPDAEPWFDRLHFLVWANNYDFRTGELVWWWSAKAARAHDGSRIVPATDAAGPDDGDLELRDGTIVLVDGGPRTVWDDDGLPVVPADAVDVGHGAVAPPARPPVDRTYEDLASDQQAAVDHRSGPARVIAPAGSGKTRVLTERLRHLLVDRAYEPSTVLAVAYNKEAQLEMERRVVGRAGHAKPHVRTLNSLGLWVLAQHRGSSPPVVDEREVRRLVESLLPGRRQRRSNTDPIGPYVEALGTVRLGLVDPDDVEQSRDDVDGLAQMFAPYRKQLADRCVVDFDEQIYAAI
ncbi:hypothetical protein BH24ACT5_BH24ACT5_23560 [soil metagenome]